MLIALVIGVNGHASVTHHGLRTGGSDHHFAGADGYKRDLLAHYESLTVGALESAIDALGADASVPAVLEALTGLIRADRPGLYRPELDVAVRAWSTSDTDVRAVQQRIDTARVEALQRVWSRVVPTDEARLSALLPYLLAVGAAVVVPPVPADDLRRLYELLLPLVPTSRASTSG